MLTVGSLFAGIGGFDLGLERTGGFEVKFQVEIDAYCQRVLAKHWPNVRRYGDIREVSACEPVDVLCGGFPCQDISNAGKRAGIDGERSGLWSEYVRLIREIRPRYVLVENVAALLGRGMGRVLGDLSESGYDAEWDVIPASAVGAPHLRERLWILAYPAGVERLDGSDVRRLCTNVLPEGERGDEAQRRKDWELAELVPGICPRVSEDWWKAQSRMDRSVNGLPRWMDRNHGLGNAIVPQIATWIGQRILDHEARQ